MHEVQMQDLTGTETTGSNTQSQDDNPVLDEMLANPAQFRTQLEELLTELSCVAEEDRWLSEAVIEEIESALWYDAHEQTTPSNTPSEDGGNGKDDEVMDHEPRQIHTKYGPTLPTLRTDESVRPSEAGWVSYNDDPWTTSKDMAAKTKADLAAELYEFTTQAGTGWWGELSEAGFGPKALVPFKSAHKDCADFDPERAVHIPAEDESLIRREAGFRWDESSQYRVRIRGQYRDYLAAAGVFPIETDEDDEVVRHDDDVWDAEGVWNDGAWEALLQAEGLEVI